MTDHDPPPPDNDADGYVDDIDDPDRLEAIEASARELERPTRALAATNGHQPDRIPPHNLDIEESLLGAMLLSADARDHALPRVEAADYYKPSHGHIHQAITVLHYQGPVDPVLVAHRLDQQGQLETVGGVSALAHLMAAVPATSNAWRYCDDLLDLSRRRQIITAAADIADYARTADHATDVVLYANNAMSAPRLDNNAVAGEDVAAVMRGEVEALTPTMLTRTDGQSLIYPGLLHWLMGDPGKGKTWVSLYCIAECLRAGRHVVMLDWEGNRRIVGDRLNELGVTPEVVEELLLYWRPPRLTTSHIAALVRHCTDNDVALVVYDAAAKALARNDYDEDKAPQVIFWLELAVSPITETGAAVLVLDHLKKDTETRGLWPRGSGAKQGEVSGAAWKVKERQGFSRHNAGYVDLIQAKDREGHVGEDGSTVARVHVTPGVGAGKVRVEPPEGDDKAFEPTDRMVEVSAFVAEANANGDHPSQKLIEEGVGGRREITRQAIARLVQHGHLTRGADGRPNYEHTIVRPYLADGDPGPTPPPPEMEEF